MKPRAATLTATTGDVVAAARQAFTLRRERSEPLRRWYYDSFDGRLEEHGITLFTQSARLTCLSGGA